MGEKEGAKKKQCKIKVSVKRNDGKRRDAEEDGGRKIEMSVKKIEVDKQIKLKNAVLDFMRRVEVEKSKRNQVKMTRIIRRR